MTCPTCQGTMSPKTVNTAKGTRVVQECNQDNGDCLNDKGYPTSVWPKGNGARAPQQQRSAPPARGTTAQQQPADTPRQYLMRAANLLSLCYHAADSVIGPDYEGEDVRTLFIQAVKAGMVAKMPAKPMRDEEPPTAPNHAHEPAPPLEDQDEVPF